MAKLAGSNLDAYTRVAVQLILTRYPEWEPFATVSSRPDGAGDVVDFNIPCPSPGVESGLWISTADEEFSVGFHTCHQHFDQMEVGLEHAAAVVEERIGVVSYYRAGDWIGSRFVALPHAGPLPRLRDGLRVQIVAEFPLGIAECDRITLRSWSGRFDRDE